MNAEDDHMWEGTIHKATDKVIDVSWCTSDSFLVSSIHDALILRMQRETPVPAIGTTLLTSHIVIEFNSLYDSQG